MESVPAYAAVAAAGVGAALDLRFRRIPNWLTGSVLLTGLIANALLRGIDGVAAALAGAALGLALLLPFYAIRAMGGGDVKLLAGVGALVGPNMLVTVAVYGGILGGVLSLLVLLVHGRLLERVHQIAVLRSLPSRSGLKAPYAVAIAGGVVLALLLPGVLG
jgi:prepilin peptidase CpaA